MKRKTAPALTWITTFAILLSFCASLTFSQRTAAQRAESHPANENLPLLSKYATDLTALARRGQLEFAGNHEADVARVVDRLSTIAYHSLYRLFRWQICN